MSVAEAFFDTKVLLYLRSADAGTADRAEALVGEDGVISVQVLNECASVASRKPGMAGGRNSRRAGTHTHLVSSRASDG